MSTRLSAAIVACRTAAGGGRGGRRWRAAGRRRRCRRCRSGPTAAGSPRFGWALPTTTCGSAGASRLPTASLQGTDLLRCACQGGCDARRQRRGVEHADHQLRSPEAARPASSSKRAGRGRLSSARDRRVDHGVSRRQHRSRRRDAAARVRVRQGDQRAADHHERRCGESSRARQARRGVRDQRRAREQGRSEDRDGRARGARQAHGRERPSRRLGAGRHQGGRRARRREGQAAAHHRRRPQRAERACARRAARRRRRRARRLLPRGVQSGSQAAVDYGRVDRRDRSRHGEEPAARSSA